MTPEIGTHAAEVLRPRPSPYNPHRPWPRQHAFLLLSVREALFGGAAGGGKSDVLLMDALQYVDVPGFAAILFRRTYTDLSIPGALMDRSKDWLTGKGARWAEMDKTWHFPAGGSVTFGYLHSATDKYRYQSAEFQYVGFDELTQFPEADYLYLFSRLRKPAEGPLSRVPLKMRAASNPGGIGHEWVRQRFICSCGALDQGEPLHKGDCSRIASGRIYIPSKLEDNPSIDRESYEASLSELDPITRLQLLNGDWTARMAGNKFRREWFEIVDEVPQQGTRWCRYWDLAATEAQPGTDPDWTAGALVGLNDGVWYIADMRRVRARPKAVDELIGATADADDAMRGRRLPVWIEQEPGASGKALADHLARRVLVGHDFKPDKPSKNKETRANPVSSAAEARNVKLVRGAWNAAFLEEAEAFPHGTHDDQVDAVSGAFNAITTMRKGTAAGF